MSQKPDPAFRWEEAGIEHKISHEELAEMVGTTRPRISMFMQRFRNLGLVDKSAGRFLIIKENKLTDYLAQFRTSRHALPTFYSEIV